MNTFMKSINHGVGPERLQALRLPGAGSRRDHAGAQHLGELQGEQGDAAGSLRQHGIAGPDAGERGPGGDAGARQRCGLFEGQMRRSEDE
jgi:hypothetical protein